MSRECSKVEGEEEEEEEGEGRSREETCARRKRDVCEGPFGLVCS